MGKTVTSTSKKIVFLKPLSTFKIVCTCSLKLEGTNTSLGAAPDGTISMVPSGHCLTLPPWAREDGSGLLEDAALSAKSVGQMGSGWSAFFSPIPSEESCPQRTRLQQTCPCKGRVPWFRWGPQVGQVWLILGISSRKRTSLQIWVTLPYTSFWRDKCDVCIYMLTL